MNLNKISIITVITLLLIGCGSDNSEENESNRSKYNFSMLLDVNKIKVSTKWLKESGIIVDSASLEILSNGNYGNFTIDNNTLIYTKNRETNQTDIGKFEIITERERIPLEVKVKSLYWKEAKCGKYHTIALKSDGSIWSWGYNNSGELGDGTNINRLTAVQESTKSYNWKKIDAGGWFNLAIKKDNSLWAWGNNGLSQFGDGTSDSSNIPKQISSRDWKDISAGKSHTLALQSNNTLWTWGSNINGQVGNNSTSIVNRPYQVAGKWQSISAGENYSIAIKDDQTVLSWGSNSFGQLGIGSTNTKYTPTKLDISGFKEIATGDYHTLAIKDRTLFGWGMNGFGELTDNGDGTDEIHTPKKINFGIVKKMCAGANYSLAIKDNGTLWGWGNNQYAQLGTNSFEVSLKTPTQEATKSNNWIDIDCGTVHSVGIKSNGTLWIWGSNDNGELGVGSTEKRATPTHILGRNL